MMKQSMGRKSKSIANRRVARMNVGETSKSRSQEAVETLKRFQHLNMHDTDSSSEKWLQKQEDQDALLLKAENLRSEIDYLEYSKEWLLNQEEHDALRLKAEKLRSELDDLQILNDRLCGEGVEAMTLTELRSLIGQLKQGLLSVRNQLAKKKIELEEFERNMVKQELGEEEDTDTDAGKLLIRTKREHGLVIQKRLCRSRTYIRKIARGLRTRGETRKHWDDCETLIRSVRYMKKEIPRLRLLNRRMLGEEIDGLDYFELMILRKEIHNGIGNMGHWIVRKLWAENERLGKKVSM